MLNLGLSLGSSHIQNKRNKERKKQRKLSMSDGNPERRNLVLLSVAIILFHLADGGFIDKKLKLPFINIQFDNFEILGSFIWILLFWFLLRYWQTTKGNFTTEFRSELSDVSSKSFIMMMYIKFKRNLHYKKINGYESIYLQPVSESNYKIVLSNKILEGEIKKGKVTKVTKKVAFEEKESILLNNFIGKTILLLTKIETAIVRPSFNAYIMPYIILSFALLTVFLHSEFYKTMVNNYFN